MRQFQVFCHLISIMLALSSIEALHYAKTGCKDSCGEVTIPYPFGIGANCSINKWYAVACNSSTPYLSAFKDMEVVYVYLERQTITVNVFNTHSTVRNSGQIPSVDLEGSPFLFSEPDNIFAVEGCGNAVILDNGSVITGCSTNCPNDTFIERGNCFGIRCCRTTIPHYLKSYSVNLTSLEGLARDESSMSAFLVDKGRYSDTGPYQSVNWDFVPITLLWTLTEDDLDEAAACWESERGRQVLSLGDDTSVVSRQCFCRLGREGNPYLHHRCEGESEQCRYCKASGRLCNYVKEDLDESSHTWSFTCIYPAMYNNSQDFGNRKSPLGVILGATVSIGLLFLAKLIYELHVTIKKTKAKIRKQRFFKRNGGLLLKQQEAVDPGLVDKTILFTSKELETATDHFSENRILGRGGQGTVYKGMLADGRIVAVKKSKIVDESQLMQFINEVVILSQVNHRNVVKLLGCCLETEVPLLVFEFVPNGTLYDLIQDDSGESPFSLNVRLQIAAEVAGALSYLHSATSIPIYHRDVKSTNILLDEKSRAKVSDFGTSRFVSVGQTHLTTLVKGTFGYFDPEYFRSSQFTEKSDVYSFGVVLLELLTREKPISLTRFGEHRSLAVHFMLAMEEGRVLSVFDPMVVSEGSEAELLAVSNLAMRCLDSNGKNRPTMKEVATELEGMMMANVQSTRQISFEHVNYSDVLSMDTYDESVETSMSFKDSNIQ